MTVLTSPKGKAIFPHLTEADTMFHPEGLFHVKLECPKAESEKILSAIKMVLLKRLRNNMMITQTKLSNMHLNLMKSRMIKLSLLQTKS